VELPTSNTVARRRGKEAERAVARKLGGQRVGNTGRATCDVRAGRLAVECKARKALPSWLVDAVSQAHANAAPGQLAVVVLHETGQRYDDALVVVRLSEWHEWYGELALPEASHA